MPMEGERRTKRFEMSLLLFGEGGGRFDEMKVQYSDKVGMMLGKGCKYVVGKVTSVGSLFDDVNRGRGFEGLMKFHDLEGDQLAEEGAGRNGCKKIPLASGSCFAGGVVPDLRLIQRNFHKTIKSQRSMMMNLLQEK